MDDVAVWGLAMDPSGVEEGERRFDQATERIEKRAARTQSVVDRLSQSFDRTAQAAQRLQRDAAAAGDVRASARDAALGTVAELERVYKAEMARVREALFRGMLSPDQARRAGREAATAFNDGLLTALQKGRALGAWAGDDGERAFVGVAGQLKSVEQRAHGAGMAMVGLKIGLGAVAAQAAGVSPTLGMLASSLLEISMGNTQAIVAVAAIAALALAYQKLTEKTREAKKALEEYRQTDDARRPTSRAFELVAGAVQGTPFASRVDVPGLTKQIDELQKAQRGLRDEMTSGGIIGRFNEQEQALRGLRTMYLEGKVSIEAAQQALVEFARTHPDYGPQIAQTLAWMRQNEQLTESLQVLIATEKQAKAQRDEFRATFGTGSDAPIRRDLGKVEAQLGAVRTGGTRGLESIDREQQALELAKERWAEYVKTKEGAAYAELTFQAALQGGAGVMRDATTEATHLLQVTRQLVTTTADLAGERRVAAMRERIPGLVRDLAAVAAAYRDQGLLAGKAAEQHAELNAAVRSATEGLRGQAAAQAAALATEEVLARRRSEKAKELAAAEAAYAQRVRDTVHAGAQQRIQLEHEIQLLQAKEDRQEALRAAQQYELDLMTAFQTAYGEELQALLKNANAAYQYRLQLIAVREEKERQAKIREQLQAGPNLAIAGTVKVLADSVTRAIDQAGFGPRSSQKLSKLLAEPFLEAIRNVENAFERTFRSILQEWRFTVKDLADLLLDAFAGALAAIATMVTARALGLDRLMDVLKKGGTWEKAVGQLSGVQKGALGGLAGFGVGYGIGGAVGSAGAGAAAGALGGALAGSAFGPVGTFVGAVTGFVGGMLGGSKAAREAAAQMEEARRRWERSLTAFIDSVQGISALEQGVKDLGRTVADLLKQAADAHGYTSGFKNLPESVSFDWIQDYLKVIEAQRQAGIKFSANDEAFIREVQKIADTYGEALKKLQEQQALARRVFDQDLAIRRAELEGRTHEAAMLRKIAEQQEEYRKAVESRMYTDEQLAALQRLLGDELQRFVSDLADAVRRFHEELRAGLQTRALTAAGYGYEAESVAREHEFRQQYDEAKAGGATSEELAYLLGVQNLERYAASSAHQLEQMEAAARAQVDAAERQVDLAQRGLQLQEEAVRTAEAQLRTTQQALATLRKFQDDLTRGPAALLSPEAQLAADRLAYQTTLAKARAGDQEAVGQIATVGSQYLDSARNYYASGPAYQAILDAVRADTAGMVDQYEAQSALQEALLKVAQDQLGVLKSALASAQAAAAQANANAAAAIEEARRTREQTLTAMLYQLKLLVMATKPGATSTPTDGGTAGIDRDQWLPGYTGPITSTATGQTYTLPIGATNMSTTDWIDGTEYTSIYYNGGRYRLEGEHTIGMSGDGLFVDGRLTDPSTLPTFARGGDHLGGLRIVGEDGPELEATGPARIWSARETAAMLAGRGDEASKEELQAQTRELRAIVRQQAAGFTRLVAAVERMGRVLEEQQQRQRLLTDGDQ